MLPGNRSVVVFWGSGSQQRKGDVLCGDGQMNDSIKALDGGGTTLRGLMGVGKEGGRAGIERMDRREFVLCDHCFMFPGAEGRQYFTGV